MTRRNYVVGLVQLVQTGMECKSFLACWSHLRQQSLEQDGYQIQTIRFDGLDRNHARQIAEHAGGCEI